MNNQDFDQEHISFMWDLMEQRKQIKDDELKEILREKFGFNEQARLKLMTLMNHSGFIQIDTIGDKIIYQIGKQEKKKQQIASDDKIEQQIFNLIQDRQTEGITKNELKKITQLNATLIKKTLNILIKQNLVTSYKTKKKNLLIYVSSQYLPDEDLIGGNLFNKGEINQEFIGKLNDRVTDYLTEKQMVTYKELLGVLTSNEGRFLSEQEIQSVLNVMIIDGIIKKQQGEFCLKSQQNFFEQEQIQKIPCFNCSLFDECQIGTLISPEKCIYFENWQLNKKQVINKKKQINKKKSIFQAISN